MSSVSPSSQSPSFPALQAFAMLDDKILPSLTPLIESRLALKNLVLSNPYVSSFALNALEEIANTFNPLKTIKEDERPIETARRKIMSYGRMANEKQKRPLTIDERNHIDEVVAKFIKEYDAMTRKFFNQYSEHTVARKAFKQEIKEKFDRLVEERLLGVSPFVEVGNSAGFVINLLNVNDKTKAYLRYKVNYVYAFESKAFTYEENKLEQLDSNVQRLAAIGKSIRFQTISENVKHSANCLCVLCCRI